MSDEELRTLLHTVIRELDDMTAKIDKTVLFCAVMVKAYASMARKSGLEGMMVRKMIPAEFLTTFSEFEHLFEELEEVS